VKGAPYSGIAGSTGGPAGSIEWAYNRSEDVMQVQSDGGPFYAYGPKNDGDRSSIHDNFGSIKATIARGWNLRQCEGVYLDNGATRWDVYSNVISTSYGPSWGFNNAPNSSLNVHDNFANVTTWDNGTPAEPTVVIQAATAITGTDPAGWPTAAQDIYNAAGLDPQDTAGVIGPSLLTWNGIDGLISSSYVDTLPALPITVMPALPAALAGAQQSAATLGSYADAVVVTPAFGDTTVAAHPGVQIEGDFQTERPAGVLARSFMLGMSFLGGPYEREATDLVADTQAAVALGAQVGAQYTEHDAVGGLDSPFRIGNVADAQYRPRIRARVFSAHTALVQARAGSSTRSPEVTGVIKVVIRVATAGSREGSLVKTSSVRVR